MLKFKLLVLALSIIVFTLGIWAFWLEPSSFIATTTQIKLRDWPKQCEGLKIVLLSDLHVGSPHNGLDNLTKVVAATNSIHPDLILLAGDFIVDDMLGGTFVKPEPIAHELKKFSARLGVYAVLGNHDWWYSGQKVKAAFQQNSIALLENTAIQIQDGNCKFWLVGIGDYMMGKHNPFRALKSIPDPDTAIAFTHNPDIFYELPDRIAITFAGHTHGGQVDLPFLGRMIVPSRYGEKFASGHIVEGERNMFVTTGIGTSILPVRFRVPPEISVVELYSGGVN
jgi:uncharacterized protein